MYRVFSADPSPGHWTGNYSLTFAVSARKAAILALKMGLALRSRGSEQGRSVCDLKSLYPTLTYGLTMSTTIQLQPETRSRLDSLKIHPLESYDEMLNRIMDVLFDPEQLSEETLQRIEEGLADMRAGRSRPFEDYVRERGL